MKDSQHNLGILILNQCPPLNPSRRCNVLHWCYVRLRQWVWTPQGPATPTERFHAHDQASPEVWVLTSAQLNEKTRRDMNRNANRKAKGIQSWAFSDGISCLSKETYRKHPPSTIHPKAKTDTSTENVCHPIPDLFLARRNGANSSS